MAGWVFSPACGSGLTVGVSSQGADSGPQESHCHLLSFSMSRHMPVSPFCRKVRPPPPTVTHEPESGWGCGPGWPAHGDMQCRLGTQATWARQVSPGTGGDHQVQRQPMRPRSSNSGHHRCRDGLHRGFCYVTSPAKKWNTTAWASEGHPALGAAGPWVRQALEELLEDGEKRGCGSVARRVNKRP